MLMKVSIVFWVKTIKNLIQMNKTEIKTKVTLVLRIHFLSKIHFTFMILTDPFIPKNSCSHKIHFMSL